VRFSMENLMSNRFLSHSGEIIEVYPDKNVTLISATEKLVHPLFPTVFQEDLKRLIERKKVNVGLMLHNFVILSLF